MFAFYRYAYYQQQAGAVDPYSAAAQAAYLPAMGAGSFGGGFAGSPSDFAMNNGGGFGMSPLQLDQQQQLALMSGQLSQLTVSGGDMNGGGIGVSGGQPGAFDQLNSLGVFVSPPVNRGGRMHPGA